MSRGKISKGKKGRKSFLAPIKQNLIDRLSNTDARMRRNMLKVLGVIVCVFMLYTVFSGDCGFIRIAKLHLHKHRLAKTNHELLARLVDAELTAKRLQNDMNYIEYIARTKHYLSKPGETIYRFTK